MIISTKGRYGIRVMIDLAQHGNDGYIPLKTIAVSLPHPACLAEARCSDQRIFGRHYPGRFDDSTKYGRRLLKPY